MLHLTNPEADHLARHAEAAALALRELAAEHRSRADAMHVIGEQLMQWYHEGRHEVLIELAEQVEQDAEDLRARRKPKTPSRPPMMAQPVRNTKPRPPMSEHQRRMAIAEAHTNRPGVVRPAP